jgi:hypothetical protein
MTQINDNLFLVENYGTVGAGTDQVAINAAIAAAVANGGGSVVFQNRIYSITTPIVVPSGNSNGYVEGLNLVSDGSVSGSNTLGNTRILANAPMAAMLAPYYIRNIHIKNLTFDGNNLATYGIHLNYTNGIVLRDVTIRHCVTACIFREHSFLDVFDHVDIWPSAGTIGIKIGDICTDTTIRDSHILGGAIGIELKTGLPVNIRDCIIEMQTSCAIDASQATGVQALNITGNYFELLDNTQVIRIGDGVTGFDITGNLFSVPGSSNANAGVYLSGNTALSGTISSNYFYSGIKTAVANYNSANACTYFNNALNNPSYTLETNDWTGFSLAVDQNGQIQSPVRGVKFGLGLTPIAAREHIADATGADAAIINAIIDVLEAFGLVLPAA